MSFNVITKFEKKIAGFYGSPYAVAVDCCTHGLELCLRYNKSDYINVPKRTYISIPFLSKKLGIDLYWREEIWEDYYEIWDDYNGHKSTIIDAAVLWKRDSYIPRTLMCVSFQFRKHLSLGRGGIILTDNEKSYKELKKMVYDGRLPDIPWRDQDISSMGYHYYMTPETAQLGLDKLPNAIKTPPHKWTIEDWPDLTQMKIFQTSKNINNIIK